MNSRKILAIVIVIVVVISIPVAVVIQRKIAERKKMSSIAGPICPPGIPPGTLMPKDETRFKGCEAAPDGVAPPPAPITATPMPTAVQEAKPADVDRNGCVGIVDFNAWFQAFRTGIARSGTAPDINKDGVISVVDFNLWFRAMLTSPKSDLCGGA